LRAKKSTKNAKKTGKVYANAPFSPAFRRFSYFQPAETPVF
jgi:hypothetical protein